MTTYTPIQFDATAFNCPICGAFSGHVWSYAKKFDKKTAITGGNLV